MPTMTDSGGGSKNTYFEIVNQDHLVNGEVMSDAVEGNAIVSNANMGDSNKDNYSSFVNGAMPAFTHDGTIAVYYHGAYPFKNILELAGIDSLADSSLTQNQGESDDDFQARRINSVPDHLRNHYGDWPSLETFVVNESS